MRCQGTLAYALTAEANFPALGELHRIASPRVTTESATEPLTGQTLPHRQILAVFADVDQPVRARDACQALDLGLQPKYIEGICSKLVSCQGDPGMSCGQPSFRSCARDTSANAAKSFAVASAAVVPR